MKSFDFYRYVLNCSAIAMLASCGGSQPPAGVPGALPQSGAMATHAERSFFSKRRTASCPCLYVANRGNARNTSSVTVYPIGANGNSKPIQDIQGSKTGLGRPHDVAVDAKGDIYVVNTAFWSVTVYAPGATGDAKPIQTIRGRRTALAFPTGIAIDSVNGDIYVLNNKTDSYGEGSITIYKRGATGNVKPAKVIEGLATLLMWPNTLALDASGNIYVTNRYNYITFYPAGSAGNASPTRIIAGSLSEMHLPTQVALDATLNVYVANYNGRSASVYAAGADGNVAPIQAIHGGRTNIAGAFGAAVDADGDIYVANAYNNRFTALEGRITVYAAGANGDVRPIRTIEGDRTGLTFPTGLVIH
jgi:hypothetical protein